MADAPNIGNTGFISELDIRLFLRDSDPSANLLLDDYEFTQEELRTCWTLIVDKWNETPPNIQSFEVHTFPYRYHLLMGTSAMLLRIAAMRYRRNDLQYAIPGGSINDQRKAPEYDAASDKLMKEFDTWMLREKNRLNMEAGWAQI